MAYTIDLKTFTDERGSLTVIEKIIPFDIKRIYYIYEVDSSKRGGHRHNRVTQAAICLMGSCEIYNSDGKQEKTYVLDRPSKCLIIEPSDWHTMYNFSKDAILMILASEYYDEKDYIYESYNRI